MLVMTLYDGEAINIGDNVKVVIDRCTDDGDTTRIGVEAPQSVRILREELIKED